MRKLMSTGIVIGFSLLSTASAQIVKEGGFYIAAHGGYNVIISGTRGLDYLGISSGVSMYTVNRSGDNIEAIPYSFGKGMNAGINVGYMFTGNMGVELGADYLLGGKNKFTTVVTDGNGTLNMSAKMIQLRPMMVVARGGNKINPYAKVGLVLGIGGKITSEHEAIYSGNTEEVVFVRDKGLALGFTGAGGVDFGINDKMCIFSEISFTGLSFSPQKGKMTKALINGVDRLPDLAVKEKEFDYVNNANPTGGSASEPVEMPKSSYSFNSAGINVGLKFKL